jgi:hypothetical protein
MSADSVKPFLITKDEDGQVRLTLREMRHNGQGYPWILPTLVDQCFGTVSAARKYASENFGAKPGEFATK